jgi:hypothetical protein
VNPSSGDVDTAVLKGGPLDGREHPVQVDTAELIVVMTDGAQHRYVESATREALADGRVVPVFEYRAGNTRADRPTAASSAVARR